MDAVRERRIRTVDSATLLRLVPCRLRICVEMKSCLSMNSPADRRTRSVTRPSIDTRLVSPSVGCMTSLVYVDNDNGA
jgi:hypothetical protein